MRRATVEDYLSRLNDEQHKVVAVGPGLCVVAGTPGSGKTTSIVGRVARLVRDGLPGRFILAVTFTKAAAAELTNRLADLGITDCRFGTIHSLCWEFLQAENDLVRSGMLHVEDGFKLELELKHVITQFSQRKRIPDRGVDLMELERYISDCKATGPCYTFGNPFGLNSEAEARQLGRASLFSERVGNIREEVLYEIYAELELRRNALSCLTYDDMITWAWSQLASDPRALQRWRNRWSAVIIDEAQDSTPLQWDLGFCLAGYPSLISPERLSALPEPERKSLMIAGQVAQSLYSFRSADPQIFIELCTSPEAGLFELRTNYRSVPEICAVAESFAKGEEWAIPETIVSHSDDWSEPAFNFSTHPHGVVEAAAIARKLKELIAGGHPLPEIAVMCRLSFFLNLVEIECIRHKIPYVKRTAGGFIESKEAQAVLAYLRVACGADPDGSSLKRTIMTPFKYISRDELAEGELRVRQSEGAGVRKLNLLEALLQISMVKRKKRSLLDLRDLLFDLAGDVERGRAPAEIMRKIIDATDFLEHIRAEDGSPVPDASKAGVLDELVGLAKLFGDASSFLTFCDQLKASLKMGRQYYLVKEEAPRDAVVLSTIHRCKGLQYQTCFIADVNQGRFPWNRATSMAEELRLMYTAVTRAKRRVFISNSLAEGEVESSILVRLKRAVEGVRSHRAKLAS